MFPDLITEIQNTACCHKNTIQLRNNLQQILIFYTSGGPLTRGAAPYREVCGDLFSVNVRQETQPR